MAYWLYCQACKQWSKSATPLSDDKSCSFCNKLFVNVKQYTNSVSDKVVIEKLKGLQNRPTIPKTTEIPEEKEIFTTQETPEIPETSVMIETTERPEGGPSTSRGDL